MDPIENQSNGSSPRVLVCQRGSRHRYAIPRLLHEEGLLAGLYTDSSAVSRIGRLAGALAARGLARKKMQALGGRRPEGIPLDKIVSFDRLFYSSLLGGRLFADLGSSYIRHGLQGADIVYNMYGEDLSFLEWAKRQGCRVAVDVFVHPDTLRIVDAELRRYEGSGSTPRGLIDAHKEHSRRTFNLADLLVCPSEWVASGVREMFPGCAEKIRVVPYGSSVMRADAINFDTRPGRILFAGREALRKGLHYLADAARLVRSKGHDIDVRVAGASLNQLGWMPHAGELNCLGTLPMDKMQDEFRQADMFVLPSLSEGQAGVLLEAMACGCPVVATRESGVDFLDGCGVMVPACNSQVLADVLCEVIENRGKRNALAEGALRQSAEYSMDAWRQRLANLAGEMGADG